jgi:flagellar assembly factor FliW
LIIENTRFGAIEIKDEKIITMKRGIPGFPGRNRFVMLNREESHPFLWYQCVDDPKLAFVLLNPFLLKPDFSFDFNPILSEMSWQTDETSSLAIFIIVNASSGDPAKMTANLMAPLIINTKRYEAIQHILQDGVYSHKYPICQKDNNGAQGQLAATG